MGIELAIITAVVSAAASVTGGVMAHQQGKAQAKAAARQGDILAKESEKKTLKLAAAQKASFLSSGLTLEGTPQDVIGETFTLGKEDIGQIKDYYGQQAKNAYSAGRTQLITGIASAAGTLAIAGMGLASAGGSLAGSAGSSSAGGSLAGSAGSSSAGGTIGAGFTANMADITKDFGKAAATFGSR
jgi:hypothetical protein